MLALACGVLVLLSLSFIAPCFLRHEGSSDIAVSVQHDGRYVAGEPLLLGLDFQDPAHFLVNMPHEVEIERLLDADRAERLWLTRSEARTANVSTEHPSEVTAARRVPSAWLVLRSQCDPGLLRIVARLRWKRFGFLKREVVSQECRIRVLRPTDAEQQAIALLPAVPGLDSSQAWRHLTRLEEEELRKYVVRHGQSRIRQYALYALSLTPRKALGDSLDEYLVKRIDDLNQFGSIQDGSSLLKQYAQWRAQELTRLAKESQGGNGTQGPRDQRP